MIQQLAILDGRKIDLEEFTQPIAFAWMTEEEKTKKDLLHQAHAEKLSFLF